MYINFGLLNEKTLFLRINGLTRKIPSLDVSTTRIRFKRGMELLPQSSLTAEDALKILWDDQIFMNNLQGPRNMIFKTLNTTVFEIGEKIEVKIYPHDRNQDKFDVFKSKR